MIAVDFFKWPAALLAWFYSLTNNYILAISLIALVVMAITAPLVLKSTKGMLEMQRLAPEMRRIQSEHRNDRVKQQEETMKLYQEHKVNPLASCLPLLLQFPVFIIMFRVLHGLTNRASETDVFSPKYVSKSSQIYRDLVGKREMLSWGLDLARRPYQVVGDSFGKGLIYIGLVGVLGVVYLIQQKMVASRAAVSPTMSQTQQKIMQYLPVVFAVIMVFYLTGLVVYYLAQAIFRIGLNGYITHRFYKGEHSLGRQAQAAGERARELAQKDGGGGFFAQARRELGQTKQPAKNDTPTTVSKRVTPPKNRPTGNAARPPSSGKAARPGAQRPPKRKS